MRFRLRAAILVAAVIGALVAKVPPAPQRGRPFDLTLRKNCTPGKNKIALGILQKADQDRH